MKFKHKDNGHTETVSTPWLWVLLFGAFYYLVTGIWVPAIFWMLLVLSITITTASQHQSAVFFVVGAIVNIIFALFANQVVRSHYLRMGWLEVTNDYTYNVYQSKAIAPKTKKCFYCAEEVLIEAIKCKHCGSDISSPPASSLPASSEPAA